MNEIAYDPERHLSSQEVKKLAGLGERRKLDLKALLAQEQIRPVGRGRPPGFVGRAPYLWPRDPVMAWLERRGRGRRVQKSPQPAPKPAQVERNGSSDKPAYREVLATLRGLRDERCREADEAKAVKEAADARYEAAVEQWHAAQDALEAVEKAAAVG